MSYVWSADDANSRLRSSEWADAVIAALGPDAPSWIYHSVAGFGKIASAHLWPNGAYVLVSRFGIGQERVQVPLVTVTL